MTSDVPQERGVGDGHTSPSQVSTYVPNIQIIFQPVGDNFPKITLEDWSDESYFAQMGTYLEDKCGTGIYKIIDNHPPCLKINGFPYSTSCNIYNYPVNNGKDESYTEIHFSESNKNEIKMKDIEFENVGPYSIKCEWKRLRNHDNLLFPVKISPSIDQKIYFDSRSFILIPGEKKKLGIGFQSKFSGVFNEEWEFLTIPKVHANKIIFKFKGLTEEKIENEPWKIYGEHLRVVESETCVKEIIHTILRKIFDKPINSKGPENLNLESEEESFLYINGDMYSYDENNFKILQEIYFNNFDKQWNGNLKDLEDEMTLINLINEDTKLIKKIKIQMIKSDRNILQRKSYTKYNQVFELLGAMVNEIQRKMDMIMRQHGIKVVPIIDNENKPNYFYFPIPKIEKEQKDEKGKSQKGKKSDKKSKQTKESKKTAKTEKSGSKKEKTGKFSSKKEKNKRDYIELMPKQINKIYYKEWHPENSEYAEDVYSTVYGIVSVAVENMVNLLENEPIMIQSSSKSIRSTLALK